jgi:CRISPR/Cas system CMR-associated protein Cmr3 (group 5 of RAMP superfamily)
MNRVAIIEEENRQIEQQISEILEETKLEETKSTKVLIDSVSTTPQPQPQTGYRRVPGYIQLSSLLDDHLSISIHRFNICRRNKFEIFRKIL